MTTLSGGYGDCISNLSPVRETLSPPAIIEAMPSHVITVRHTEPSDLEAFYKIFSQPGAVHGTAQLPFPSAES